MNSFMETALLSAVMASTLRGTAPILLAALGETFVEASGLLNLGIEGMMTAGAFTAFLVGLKLNSLFLGFLSAALVGLLLGIIFGVMTINLRVNQVVVGIALTIFANSMCSFLYRVIFGNRFPLLSNAGGTNEIPILSKIPFVGGIFFNQHWLVYVAFLLVPGLYFLMYKTSFGLRVRAVGDTPWAADTAGISVYRVRSFSIVIGGILAGLAGAFLSLGDLSFFVPNMIMGRGWIAIAVVMQGKWNPKKVFGGALLFGFALSLTSTLQIAGISISPDFILMLPYLVVIAALVIFARSANLPPALCVPYKRGEK